jgi:hypothetical protein
MFGVEYFSCTLPLNFICRPPSLDHGHETSWWRERLFFDGWLPWLDVLDRGPVGPVVPHFPVGWAVVAER